MNDETSQDDSGMFGAADCSACVCGAGPNPDKTATHCWWCGGKYAGMTPGQRWEMDVNLAKTMGDRDRLDELLSSPVPVKTLFKSLEQRSLPVFRVNVICQGEEKPLDVILVGNNLIESLFDFGKALVRGEITHGIFSVDLVSRPIPEVGRTGDQQQAVTDVESKDKP